MGKTPKKRVCQRLLTFSQALRFSYAPLLYGSKPLTLPVFCLRTLVVSDRSAGRAGGAVKRAGSSVSSTSVRPPNHLANHITAFFPNYSQINRISCSCESQNYTRADTGKCPIARTVRSITLHPRPLVLCVTRR